MNLHYSLSVLTALESDPLFSSFRSFAKERTEESYSAFLCELFRHGAQDNFSAYIADKILYDVNVFSVSAANGKEISPYIKKAYRNDLSAIYALLLGNEHEEDYCTGRASDLFFADWGNDTTIDNLTAFYRKYGYGEFIRYKAFRYEDGKLKPIDSVSPVRLSDLKDYESEKKIIGDNIENFLSELPFSNMLLYGARGTGKSSTIHAMLNQYYENGLRLVELSKENMLSLHILKGELSDIPLKFMIYIDDLSLGAGDERISSLKGSLEGSVEGHAPNAMIVATSNRRHIIDEKFSAREDSIHAEDNEQEELSLSDRFGISVLFATTTKAQYLSIVDQLADDFSIKTDRETLNALAERWALQKGGRSPRRAKQFISLVFSCEQRNIPIEF